VAFSEPALVDALLAGIYELGNNGGLIILSPHKLEGPTDAVFISPDQGACWHKVALPEAMSVENIRWVEVAEVGVRILQQ
jgi:hypothetical protein